MLVQKVSKDSIKTSGFFHQVPPPLPSAPPVGSQWDLRQLQLNSPTRPDQPPTPTTPRAPPERETTPDGQQSMLLLHIDKQ